VTREGIPVRRCSWPGNAADTVVNRQVHDELCDWQLHRVLWVGDCGFANQTNRQHLQRAGGHVLFAEKLRAAADNLAALARPGRYAIVADNLHSKKSGSAEAPPDAGSSCAATSPKPNGTRPAASSAMPLHFAPLPMAPTLVDSIRGTSIPFTIVYTQSVGDVYRFDERSYEALAANGIDWQTVLQVLRARPRVRQHIGAVLRVAAQAKDGRWIAVALIEEGDDEYLVVSARELDSEEVVAVTKMIEGDTE